MRRFLPAFLALPLLATACVPPNTAPQQIQASNPTVTYKYHNDQGNCPGSRSLIDG